MSVGDKIRIFLFYLLNPDLVYGGFSIISVKTFALLLWACPVHVPISGLF